MRSNLADELRWNSGTVGSHFGAGLPRVVGESVNEAVVIIHQQQFHPLPCFRWCGCGGGTGRYSTQGAEESGGLQARLFFLKDWNRVVQQSCAHWIPGDSVTKMDGTNQ